MAHHVTVLKIKEIKCIVTDFKKINKQLRHAIFLENALLMTGDQCKGGNSDTFINWPNEFLKIFACILQTVYN